MVLPVRIAFIEKEPIGWEIVYIIIDSLFLIDLICCFFTTYTDNDNNEVTDRKKIAIQRRHFPKPARLS